MLIIFYELMFYNSMFKRNEMSVGTKFQLKQTILIFWTKYAQQGHSNTEKVNITIEFSMFELIYVSNFTFNKQFWILEPNSPKKVIPGSNTKKVNITINFSILELNTKFHFKQFWNFGLNLNKKAIFGLKQKKWILHLIQHIGISFAGIFPRMFLQPVNDSKNSMLNSVVELNLIKVPMKPKVPRKIAAAASKGCASYASEVRKSVGNDFSSNLEC